ncbi:MAG: response regulator transcription factor [Bacteroidia bacterium]|nr:response regulator transcription factor [Bacteroidia bacterium]
MELIEKVNIIIADDHAIFRDGLKSSLKKIPFVGKIYQCEDGQEVINTLEKTNVDVVLMDIEMPVMNGIETAKWIKVNMPHVNIIMLTMFNNQRYIMQLHDIGVTGYLLKNTNVNELQKAITMVKQKDNYYCKEIQEVIFRNLISRNKPNKGDTIVDKITTREIEVLKLICDQNSTHEIADKLFISPLTIKRHRQILMEKTGSKNLAGLVVFAIQHDIFRIYKE